MIRPGPNEVRADHFCAWARDRTGDLSLFRTALYQLSYPSAEPLYHISPCYFYYWADGNFCCNCFNISWKLPNCACAFALVPCTCWTVFTMSCTTGARYVI